MAKQQAEKMRKLQEKQGLLFSPGGHSPLDPRSLGLTVGLNPVQPDGTFGVPRLTTTLKARANVGQTAIELNKASGVKAGYKLYIGSGVKVDVCDVVLGGEVADRVVISYPLAYRHNAGATVLAFSTPTADEMEDAREKLLEYQLQQRELLRQAAEEEAAAKRAMEEEERGGEDEASVVSGLSAGSGAPAGANEHKKARESLFAEGDMRRKSSIAPRKSSIAQMRRSTHARNLNLRSGSVRSSSIQDLSTDMSTFNTGTPSSSEPPSEDDDEPDDDKSKSTSVMDALSEALSQEEDEVDFSGKTPAEIALESVEDGFETVKAKFEGYGDDFEDMFFKFSEDERWLTIRVLSGQGQMKFDVGGGGCFVTENGSDGSACYMDYRGNVISFKMSSAKRIQNFMDEFPATVFDYDDEEAKQAEIEEKGQVEKSPEIEEKKEYEKKEHTPYVSQQAQARKTRVKNQLNKLKEVKNKKTLDQILETLEAGKSFRPGMSSRQSLGLRAQRVVGAVEGLTGKDSVTRGEGGGTYTPFSDPSGAGNDAPVAPPRAPISSPDGADRWIKPPRGTTPTKRQELINQRIRKTTPSMKRTKMLCRWLNFLEFWDKELTVKGLHTEMCSGECLCELMKVLVPTCAKREISSYNIKPLARKPALNNIEKALGVVYRSREFNRSRIPEAKEIFEGNINKIIILLDELFIVYMQQPLYKNAPRMLKWYQKILKQYQRPLAEEVLDDGNVSSVWPAFQNGVSLFCAIYHFYGPIQIGEGETIIKIDPMRVVSFPDNYDDIRANLIYVFSLLKALEVEALWTPDEWLTYPDTEFAILQLSYVYEALRDRQCNLPAASGTTAGLTTGPDGEALVVGLTFSDTRAAGLNVHRHSKHVTALLGAGENSIPMIPVDSSQTHSGDIKDSLLSMAPMGLLSAAVRVQERSLPVKVPHTQRSTNRPKWHSGTRDDNLRVTENVNDAPMLDVLHSQHQPVKNSNEYIEGKKLRFAAASKKPLSALRRDMLLSQKTKERRDTTAVIEFDKDKLTASINQMIMETSRMDERGEELIEDEDSVAVRQLKVAMQRLEEEMNFTHKEVDGLEEELDARYMLLEEEAEDLDEEEYDNALEYLDGEGVRLENDKLRISELFSIRLKSIREQFQEAKTRSAAAKLNRREDADRKEQEARKRRANLKDRFEAVADDDSTMSGTSTLQTSGSMHAKTVSKFTKPLSEKEKKTREEGWTLHNNRTFSYNSKIQESIVKSSSKLKDHWTSPRTKQRLEKKAHEDAVKLAKKIGLDSMPKSPIGGHMALLIEKGTAASIGKESVRSAGSSKSGQYYPGSQYTLAAQAKHMHSQFETPEHVFDQFKLRLYTRTSVWLHKRGLERADDGGSKGAPRRQEVSFLIQLMATTKPFSNTTDLSQSIKAGTDTQTAISMHLSQEQLNLWSALRIDERDRMAWEETRAEMASENPDEAKGEDEDENKKQDDEDETEEDGNGESAKKGVTIQGGDDGSPDGSPGKVARSPMGMRGEFESKEDTEENVTDFATALRHCSKGRSYVLADRKGIEYIWSVDRAEVPAQGSSSRKGGLQSFVLRWKTGGGAGNPLIEAGSVLLEDLKSVEYLPAKQTSRMMGKEEGTITLNLKSSVRALKTCGGRTKLALKCLQPAEDAKWFMCLKCLWDSTGP